MQMIIISGLSGAGKSTAGEFLEDEGFYTIDNMPRHWLMPRFAELCLSGSGGYDKVAMVSDIRGGKNFDELFCALDTMREMGIDCKLLFLEASVPAIIKRFKETRRSHPLEGGTVSLSQAVEGEKLLLAPCGSGRIISLTAPTLPTTASCAAFCGRCSAPAASGCTCG